MLVLVTGGCGFIGANLVPVLLDRGHEVRVLDDLSAGDPRRLPRGVELVEGDVRNPFAAAVAIDGADAVVHLAAGGSVADSIADPVANFEINVRGTLTVLRAAIDRGVGRFVFASTGGALVGAAPPPVDERSLPHPLSPYGASKLCGEGYCDAFRSSYGLSTLALRFANVYGPRSERKRGAVTAFIQRALQLRPLVVYGDGRATRDFVHVADLCDGIAAAVQRRPVEGVVHLASGRETSIGRLAHLVLDITGADVPVTHLPARRGEVERTFATARRAAELLDFHPAVSLEDGLASTVAWFRAAHDRWAVEPVAAPA